MGKTEKRRPGGHLRNPMPRFGNLWKRIGPSCKHGPMRYAVLFVFLAVLPAQVSADTPLSGAEFDALTQGKTLTYAQDGFLYGMEEYLPNRRVRWSFLDGECHEGTWYEEGSQICFVYDGPGDLTGPQCWTFLRDAGGLRAYFMDDPGRTNPVVTLPTRQELQCTGPQVGV